MNRPDLQHYQSVPPPMPHHEYIDPISENVTVNIPILENQKSPKSHQTPSQNFLSPPRRRTTLGTPSRQHHSLSPTKSHLNLRAAADVANFDPGHRKRMSTGMPQRSDKMGGLVKLAARNTFRGRENEAADWDKECDSHPALEMPSPFIRRRGLARISAGLSRT
jgi:hypothetical protein